MARLSRRRLLAFGLAMPVGLVEAFRTAAGQGLGRFTVPTATCGDETHPTPAVPDAGFFRPGLPERQVLAGADAPGQRLRLTGVVAGMRCGPIAGARLDFWQADAGGRYDPAGFNLRGHQLSAADGGYRVDTIVPGGHAGRARCIWARVTPPQGSALTTALFFPDDPLAARDAGARPELAVHLVDPAHATFNFTLDL